LRKLAGASYTETRTSFFNSRHGIAQIEIPGQSAVDQILELLVVEDLEPFEIGERSGLRLGQRLRRPEIRRDRELRPLVVGPDRTSGQQNSRRGNRKI
jgi:hypothetical protein